MIENKENKNANLEEFKQIDEISLEEIERNKQTEIDLKSIDSSIKSVLDISTSLYNEFTNKIKVDASKDNIINTLHKELQEFRNDNQKIIIKPIIMDIINQIYSYKKKLDLIDIKSIREETYTRDVLTDICEDLEEILFIQGVISYTSTENVFDPKTQTSSKPILTNIQKQHKQIAKRIKEGYRWDNNNNNIIITKEQVQIFLYTENEVCNG